MLPNIFRNDFRSLARIQPEMLAVASLNANRKSFMGKGTAILRYIKGVRGEVFPRPSPPPAPPPAPQKRSKQVGKSNSDSS